jgi:rod shape-determining protein MreC
MHYLPLEADLMLGDTVVTSGLSALAPKGMLIGKIAEIRKEFSGLSLYCLIKPAVDFNRLEEVLVVTE